MSKYYKPGADYGWTDLNVQSFTKRMKDAVKLLGEINKKDPFDAIAFSGSSGAAIAYIAGVALQIPVIYVRKDKENSHGFQTVISNTDVGIKKYVIVDDFIATGATVKRIVAKISEGAKNQSKKCPTCVGILLYDQGSSTKFFTIDNKTIPLYYIL